MDKVEELRNALSSVDTGKIDQTEENVTVDTSQSDFDALLYGSMSSTISINSINSTPYIYTTNNTSNSFLYSGGNGQTTWTTQPTNPILKVTGDAEFDQDVKIKGVSIMKTLEGINRRLAILVPDPEKLEHFEALRKAYDHYKTLEALCQVPAKDDNS